MSEIVRTAVDKQKKEEQKKTNGAMLLLDMAKKAKKHKGSGTTDLTKNHDYYIYIEPYERQQVAFLSEIKKSKKKNE